MVVYAKDQLAEESKPVGARKLDKSSVLEKLLFNCWLIGCYVDQAGLLFPVILLPLPSK